MRLTFFLLVFLNFASLSCKKVIEQIQEDRIIDIMVSGQWIVTQFILDGNSRLAEFSPYQFQYHRNKTVDAINGGTIEYTGNWDGNVSAKTTWADFGSTPEPVSLLNGTWQITNNTLTYVILTQNNGSGNKQMRIDKI